MKRTFQLRTGNRSFRAINAARRSAKARHRGVVTIYVMLIFGLLAGIAAVSFDLSYLYNRKAEAQKAADSAALAGAVNGVDAAKTYAANNGYGAATNATVDAGLDSTGLFVVSLSRPERVEFARLFGIGVGNVGATAAAQYQQPEEIPVQNYGIGRGPVNLSVFGPYGDHENGDDISTMFLTDGKPNPKYDGKGYDFDVKMKDSIANFQSNNPNKNIEFEIFDPGTGNTGGAAGQTFDSSGNPISIDEMRPGVVPGHPLTTVTKYTVTYDVPGHSEEDIVKTYTQGADTPDTDMKWVDAFDFDPATLPAGGSFKFNVTSIDGTSENGFQLRAGPAHDPGMSETDWNNQFGDSAPGGADMSISARGSIPMNFNTNTTITIQLGSVPALPGGGSILVDKFDLDVGSTSLEYIETPTGGGPGIQQAGTLGVNGVKNDVDSTDTIVLPKNYAGGTWKAVYSAGLGDTSVWHMTYTGGNGTLRLVR